MSIQFILGRAGSGKSHFCLDDIRQRLLQDPQGSPLILLVPEQATFQAEYALVTTPEISGMIRAQALSFRRLAFRVMQETGGTTRSPIDDTGKKLLLYKALFRRKEQLQLFQHSVNQMGFIDGLNELFTELKRYCITPEGLKEHLMKKTVQSTRKYQMFDDKMHDLLLIYHDYNQMLNAQYIDGEDYLDILSEQMKDSSFIKEAEIWIDGFYGFTPQEFRVIKQLMVCSKKLHITLCIDREYGATEQPEELDLFHPTAQTLIQLQMLADQNGVKKKETLLLNESAIHNNSLPRFTDSPVLAFIERNYHSRKQWKGDAATVSFNLSIHAAVHRRAEIEGAAREMLRLVRDCGYRWRDMAVNIRNGTDYHDLITETFTDHGIPFFFDQKQPVMHHPLIEFIRSALEIVHSNWKYDSVFRCIKTNFISPENHHLMDELENYVIAFGIHGYRWTENKPWSYKRSRNIEDTKEQPSEADHQYLQRINEARDLVVKPLFIFQKKLEKSSHIRSKLQTLYELLESVNVAKRLEQWSSEAAEQGQPEKSREHTQMWGKVMDTFDQMVEVMSDDEVSIDMFIGLIEAGFESIKLGLVPPSLDQVLIGSIDRTRSTQIKYSFILGVNDGVLPQIVKGNGILSELEREQLMDSGLHLAPGSRRKLLDEQFLIYTALTVPSEHLWLSFPLADEEGKTLLPSEIIRRIRSIFPEHKTRFLMAEPLSIHEQHTQAEYIAHPERTLSYLVAQLRQWRSGVEIDLIWWDVYNWFCSQDKWRGKLHRMLYGLFYYNQENSLSVETSRALYGELLKASVSRMEKFISCPFAHFISHGLRLQDRMIYRLEAPDIGQLFHAALSLIALELQQDNMQWSLLTTEQCEARANQAVDQLSPRLQSEILLSSKRYFYISHKLKKIVGRASVVLAEHARRGAFVPIGLEVDFGEDRELPSLRFSLDNGCEMEIMGRIDRVDQAESERGVYLRIIDYKSSQTSLSLTDVYYGLSLQVLTYLDVVITHSKAWLGKKAIPAGVLYFHVHNPVLQRKNAMTSEEAEEAIFKSFKMKGLVLADSESVSFMDNTLQQGHSELIPVSIKADGSYYKHSSVMTDSQWRQIRGFVRNKIREIGTGITSGNVQIQPYRLGQKLPCTFCSYKSICQFDQQYEGNAYHYLKKLSKEDIWTHFEKVELKETRDENA